MRVTQPRFLNPNASPFHKPSQGEAFVPGFMNQSRIYLHECFAPTKFLSGKRDAPEVGASGVLTKTAQSGYRHQS
jgi:hypothetical protein